MVRTYQKGVSVPCGSHFHSTDFDCHCKRPTCTKTLIDDDLVTSLDLLWNSAGPFKIDSGYRCPAHNAEVGGARNSKHPQGEAADCKSLQGKTGKEIADVAETVPNFYTGGIGIYPTFAHCDTRKDGPARWKSGTKLSTIVPC